MSKPGYWLEVYEVAVLFLLADKQGPQAAHDKARATVDGFEPEPGEKLIDLIRE